MKYLTPRLFLSSNGELNGLLPQESIFPRHENWKMKSHTSWLFPITLSAVLFSCGCSRSHQPEQNSVGERVTTENTSPLSAEMWLRWDKSSRIAFIVGNLRGYSDGVAAGCGDANRAVKSLPGISGFTPEAADEMRMDCGARYKPSNRALESYEEVVTKFYTRYPEDRIIEIQDVLLLLAGDPKLTAEDVHKRVKITQNPKR